MPGLDLSLAQSILKEKYLGPIRNQLNISTPMLTRFDMNNIDIEGKYAVIPVKLQKNWGSGARAERAVLPVAGAAIVKDLKPALKYYYGTMEVTGPVMRQTAKGSSAAFIRAVDLEAKDMKETVGLNLAHDFYLGHSLATPKAEAGANNVLELGNATNINYFAVGMVVDIVDAAAGGNAANYDSDANYIGRSITAVSEVAGALSITIDGGGVQGTTADVVVRTKTYGECLTGLDEIVGSAALFGVDPGTYSAWQSNINDGVAFSIPNMKSFIDRISIKSGKYPTLILSDFATQNRYANLLQHVVDIGGTDFSLRQNTQPTAMKVLDGGFKELEFSAGGKGIPWMSDRFCPADTIYVLHEPDLQVFSPNKFDWLYDPSGNPWLPNLYGPSKTDTWSAVLFRDIEQGVYQRNSQGKWINIPA